MTLRGIQRRLAAKVRGTTTVERLRAQGAQIGRGVWIASRSNVDAGFAWLVSIGDGTTISSAVEILAHDASTRRHIGYTIVAPVTIGRRVYVGAGAIILPGVTIGDGAVVGAGSVVTHDVPAGTVVAGVPARVLRTVEEQAEQHRSAMERRPVFDNRTMSAAELARMRTELQGGHGYVR
jgi:maltose O-acetyltransferase